MPAESRSSTRYRHRMRCRISKCYTRFTLARAPNQYKRPIRCPACRSFYVRSVEAERARELAKRDTCECPRFPFPHAKGSMRMCMFHPKELSFVTPTFEEEQDYDSTLNTPRSTPCWGQTVPNEEDYKLPF